MRDGKTRIMRETILLSHSPIAEPPKVLAQGAPPQGSPGLPRRTLRKVLGSAERFGRGPESRRDQTDHSTSKPPITRI